MSKTKAMSKINVYSVAQTVGLMPYQPLQNFDVYYPTIDDLCTLGTYDEHGHISYSEFDLAYLCWVTRPLHPESLTKDQRRTMRYAAQLLADYANGTLNEDEDLDEAVAAEIFARHGLK